MTPEQLQALRDALIAGKVPDDKTSPDRAFLRGWNEGVQFATDRQDFEGANRNGERRGMNFYDEPRELVTGMPEHIIVGVIRALETAGAAMEVAGAAESPIEEMLGGALTAEMRRRYPLEKFGIFNPGEPNEHISGCIMLVAQFDLLRFRYDFAFRIQGFLRPFLLIECDSKQFHSSPEQIENDRRKDECAFRHGIPIMRFTGGEIHYRIDKCVSEVIKFIEEMK